MSPRARKLASHASHEPRSVRLKPHNPFDLIRLIARSQSDARKAVCELVQNSLDAGARHVEVAWFREKGVQMLRVRDDGSGVFPELERDEALQRIAQTIGHSHKHALSPSERHQQMVLGKYGIGLLGFWCVAEVMEIRSRVAGGDAWVLRLVEDRPEATVFRSRAQRSLVDGTFTEITLKGVKESVRRQVRPPRLQAYLAGELRGQLLLRETEVRIHDRVARGRATKEFVVRPRAYLGEPLEELDVLAVPGREDARLELYYVPKGEERRGVVALACGGTTVLDDIALVDPTDPEGRAREPWASGRFEGVVDFPDLDVAPGTRRGFVPNDAALDFLLALEKLERRLAERLADAEREHARERLEKVAKELRRAFRPVAEKLPQYDLMDVRLAGARRPGEPSNEPDGAPRGEDLGDVAEDGGRPEPPESLEPGPPELERDEPALFPPGPLAALELSPARLRIAPGAARRLRARPADADGRVLRENVELAWSLEGPGELAVDADAEQAVYRAPAETDGADARVVCRARQGAVVLHAEAEVRVRSSPARAARGPGIPEPRPVDAPSEPWRSRLVGDAWEFNEGHGDYRAVAGDETRRLRYLKHLYVKEIVLRNFGAPQQAELLERMVEVLTYLGNGRGG